MSLRVSVVAHSVYDGGPWVATVAARVPRVILAQINKHGLLSGSAASSRAVPTSRLSAGPVYVPEWTADRPGMSGVPLSDLDADCATGVWEQARRSMVDAALHLRDILGVHKQDANRVLEPFSYVRVVLTGTARGWANFWAVRCDHGGTGDGHDVQPAFRSFARASYVALQRSVPTVLRPGDWHLPYVTDDDRDMATRCHSPGWAEVGGWRVSADHLALLRWSTARCARVSYRTVDGAPPTVEGDERTWLKLVGSRPVHANPLAHPCMVHMGTDQPKWQASNLSPWVQFRKLWPGESTSTFDPTPGDVAAWDVPDTAIAPPGGDLDTEGE